MRLHWIKCVGDVWCGLFSLDLNSVGGTSGVYIIWSGSAVLYVGSGNVAERLATHRLDTRINQYNAPYVTWAAVPGANQPGVENYLASALRPLVGEVWPAAQPIEVNLPPW